MLIKNKGVWVGIILSLVFLYLAFNKVDFPELGRALKSANYWWVIFAIILSAASFLPRAYRWRSILNPVKPVGFGNAFGATTIGFMANSVLPVRAGEVIRAFVIGYKENISKSASFATIIIERIFDMFVLLFLLFGFLIRASFPEPIKRAGIVALGITIIALCFLVFLKVYQKGAYKIINIFPSKLKDKLSKFISSFTQGLEILTNWRTGLWVFAQSIFIWIYFAFVYYALFHAFGLQLPIEAAFIVMVICCIGIMIPSAPGFIGTYHYFAILGLSLFHIPKSEALSFAVVAWGVSFLPIVVIGLVCLQRMGVKSLRVKEFKS